VPVAKARQDDQDRHVAVLDVIAAVLGDLALAAGIDDAVLRDADDVRNPRVQVRDPGELRCLAVNADFGLSLYYVAALDALSAASASASVAALSSFRSGDSESAGPRALMLCITRRRRRANFERLATAR
jgi:hypothetical protein